MMSLRPKHLLLLCTSLSITSLASSFVILDSGSRSCRSRFSSSLASSWTSSSQSSSFSPSSSSSSSYLATCIPGLSSVLAQELIELGCHNVASTGASAAAVTFTADLRTALSALLWTRTCHKLLEYLCHGDDIRDRDSLMQFVQDSVPVKDLLGDGKGGLLTVSVQVVVTSSSSSSSSDLNHSKFTALSIKNALCDSVREMRGDRPNVDTVNPDVPLVAFIHGTTVSLYRQLHGAMSLHKRGYRQPGVPIHKAAMKESLAAGLLLYAGWKTKVENLKNMQPTTDNSSMQPCAPSLVVLDPMAGSGTLILEAAGIAADMAPGLMRIASGMPGQKLPSITRWKHQSHSSSLEEGLGGTSIPVTDIWKELLSDAAARAKNGLQWMSSSSSSSSSSQSPPIRFLANDCHPGALDLMESALNAFPALKGIAQLVEINQGDCSEWDPTQRKTKQTSAPQEEHQQNDQEKMVLPSDAEDTTTATPEEWFVVCNPPWGERLMTQDMHDAWESLRVFLRETCPAGRTEAWILSGNAAATKHLGLRKSASLACQTGQQHLRWLKYEIRDQNYKPQTSEGDEKLTSFKVVRDMQETATEQWKYEGAPVRAAPRRQERRPTTRRIESRPTTRRTNAPTTKPSFVQKHVESSSRTPPRAPKESKNEWLL